MQEIIRSSLAVIVREPNTPLVVMRRSTHHADDSNELEIFLDRFDLLLPPLRRRDLVLFMDMRDGPLRNDEAYEDRMNVAAARITAGFRRVAVLIRSSVGMLQAARLRRERPNTTGNLRTFQDEAAARAYLLSPEAGTSK